MRLGIVITVVLCFMVGIVANVEAHMAFKKTISKKYPHMKITCNACHVKSKPKSERNKFGKLFEKELKGKKITETFKALEADDKKQFQNEVMIPEFLKVLEKVKKMKPKDQELTYDELIKAGEIKEITKKPKKKADKSS